jgi:2,3-bisphosphoglycerate-independent phosphoglycerate mutase
MGWMYPVKRGFIPESDEAVISIFGNKLSSSSRGQLETRGTGLDLERGDLALRMNFATIDSLKEGNILDRRVGRTLSTSEAKQIYKSINQIKLPCKFVFEATVQHRGVVVFRGGFSEELIGNDLTYYQGSSRDPEKVTFCKSLDDDDENTQYTVNVVNEFIEKVSEMLEKHPVNKKRKEKGLMPANYVLLRGAGIEKPKLKKYKKWFSISYMPLEKGISKVSEMETFSFDYPSLKGIDAYKNLYAGLKKASKFSIKQIKKNSKNFDYAYIHFKETDVPGHDNKPLEKKKMIEYLDRTFFRFIRKFAPQKKIDVVVTADHSTPCKLKNHSADPVPVLWYNQSPPEKKSFSEKQVRLGKLGSIEGKNLLKKVKFAK